MFDRIKHKITKASALYLLDFKKVFEVSFDESNVGIDGVLSWEGNPITLFFSEKLSNPKQQYSTYDLEFYAAVQILLAFASVFGCQGVCPMLGSQDTQAPKLSCLEEGNIHYPFSRFWIYFREEN